MTRHCCCVRLSHVTRSCWPVIGRMGGAPSADQWRDVFVSADVFPGSKHSLVKIKSCVTNLCRIFESNTCLCSVYRLIQLLCRMSVTVKAYLLGKDEVVKEVRRFAVDQDVSSSFEYLCQKTAEIFNNLKSSGFNMFYKGEQHKSNNFNLFYRGYSMCWSMSLHSIVSIFEPKNTTLITTVMLPFQMKMETWLHSPLTMNFWWDWPAWRTPPSASLSKVQMSWSHRCASPWRP